MAVVEMSASDRKLYRLWRSLPADRAVSEQEAFELLEQEANRPGDNAWASAMLMSLKLVGAVSGSNRRSETFPELPEGGHNRPGSAAFNAGCEEISQRQRERNERADATAQRDHQEALAKERRESFGLLRELLRDEGADLLGALIREVAEDVFRELAGDLDTTPAALMRAQLEVRQRAA